MGTKWFVEVPTPCIAEQQLEITFQITGLELLAEVPAQPFLLLGHPCAPFPQPPAATTASAPAYTPSHLLLGVRPAKSFKSPGTYKKLNVRRHIMHKSIPDVPACETLGPLEGSWRAD